MNDLNHLSIFRAVNDLFLVKFLVRESGALDVALAVLMSIAKASSVQLCRQGDQARDFVTYFPKFRLSGFPPCQADSVEILTFWRLVLNNSLDPISHDQFHLSVGLIVVP